MRNKLFHFVVIFCAKRGVKSLVGVKQTCVMYVEPYKNRTLVVLDAAVSKKSTKVSITVVSVAIHPVSSARSLSVLVLDDELRLVKHAASLCRSCYNSFVSCVTSVDILDSILLRQTLTNLLLVDSTTATGY